MSYRDLQDRMHALLARRTLNGQTPGGTPAKVPDALRWQDAPGETRQYPKWYADEAAEQALLVEAINRNVTLSQVRAEHAETLVGGSDKRVDTAAPTHVAQTLIDATAIMDEQRGQLAAIRRKIDECELAVGRGISAGTAAIVTVVAIREIIGA